MWPFVFPITVGLVLTLLSMLWMPWEQIHPNDPDLRQSLGYAPYWSHRFADAAGAQIDWGGLTVNLLSVWVICLAAVLMLYFSTRTDN